MARVIDNKATKSHNVQKYNFKVIAMGSHDDSHPTQEVKVPIEPQLADEKIDASALSTSTKDSLIESLMKKTDEMSSNFIKLQMKYEQKEEEFKAELEKVRKEAYELGEQTGRELAQKEIQDTVQKSLQQYSESINKIENVSQSFQTSLDALKNELVVAALDIAKEVIKVEVSENPSQVATLLAEELIKDLQEASKITLKVNPQDHSVLSQHFGAMKNVTVISDSAISAGGVVVLSDVGNIDAQIQKRFERVKKAALSE